MRSLCEKVSYIFAIVFAEAVALVVLTLVVSFIITWGAILFDLWARGIS